MDVDRIYAELVKAGEEYADTDAAATALEETKKSVIAKLMQESTQTSMAGKEMEALADDSYRDYVKQMVNARKIATKARVKFDSMKIWVDLKRSAEATRRAEANIR
jgi:hypothetical protein